MVSVCALCCTLSETVDQIDGHVYNWCSGLFHQPGELGFLLGLVLVSVDLLEVFARHYALSAQREDSLIDSCVAFKDLCFEVFIDAL